MKKQSIQSKFRVQAELVKTLYQQISAALIGVVATSTGIAAIFFSHVTIFTVGTWLLAIYTLSFIRYLSSRKFKSLDEDSVDIIFWERLFSFSAFLSGLAWGAASVIFFIPEHLYLYNILTLTIIAMSVGSLAALAASPKSFYFYLVPAMLPMIWRYLSIEEQGYFIFGLLLFVLNYALVLIVKVNHKALVDAIVLRFENVELIKQLTQEKENAEQANISKTKFLAAASHDLRQPLHAIGLFVGALDERIEIENQKVILQKIKKSTQALNGLLDSLLDISKLDADVIHIERQEFAVNRLFEVLENEFRNSAEEKKLKIKFVKTKIWLNSDYRIIENILRNLISNAIRYTEVGGVVVGCRHYKGGILLVVYDTGVGIEKGDIKDIFREFHQLNNIERDRSKGLGLGLAIVERMAKLLGAPLYVKSLLGKGSAFGIVLSSTKEAVVQQVKKEPKNNTTLFDDKMILIVDDEEEVRDSITELLISWHCEVVGASSGMDAKSQIQERGVRPDIILVDYRLRDNETGVEVIEKINSLYPPSEAVAAIIITGDTAPKRIKEVESSGYKILHKPVFPDELRKLLGKALVESIKN